MAINCGFTIPGIQAVPSARRFAISVPAGFPVWISIDSVSDGSAVRKNVAYARLHPGTVYVFQSSATDLFLSGLSEDPGADSVPTPLTFLDSGASV